MREGSRSEVMRPAIRAKEGKESAAARALARVEMRCCECQTDTLEMCATRAAKWGEIAATLPPGICSSTTGKKARRSRRALKIALSIPDYAVGVPSLEVSA